MSEPLNPAEQHNEASGELLTLTEVIAMGVGGGIFSVLGLACSLALNIYYKGAVFSSGHRRLLICKKQMVLTQQIPIS